MARPQGGPDAPTFAGLPPTRAGKIRRWAQSQPLAEAEGRERMRELRGLLWLVRTYGLRRAWRYERARREGMTIDYSQIFSPAELGRLEDAGLATWQRRSRAGK